MRSRLLAALFLLLSAIPLAASDGFITSIQSPLATDFQNTYCHPPIYAPALFPLPNGDLGMMTQGNCLGHCDTNMGDSLFRWRHALANNSWADNNGGITPSSSQKTTSRGEVIPAGALSGFKMVVNESPQAADACPTTNQLTSFDGAYGSPAVVSLGGKLYMASLRGNGDWWNGEIWWAVSSDNGATWTQQTQRLIVGLNHRGHQAAGGCPEGFASLSMTTTTDASGTWFHLYSGYFHPGRELPGGTVSTVDYRILYDSTNSFGLGSTRQIFYNGAYVNSSGKLVWTYDAGAAQPGDIKLNPTLTTSSWGNGGFFFSSSVTKIGSFYYMVVAKWLAGNDPLFLARSCDGTHWSSAPLSIDASSVYALYPGHLLLNNGIYYGNYDGSGAQLWAFFSLGNYCTAGNPYDGARILPAKITLTAMPVCP
jgi:hypothetical protein